MCVLFVGLQMVHVVPFVDLAHAAYYSCGWLWLVGMYFTTHTTNAVPFVGLTHCLRNGRFSPIPTYVLFWQLVLMLFSTHDACCM